jgi:hypothetical protein
MMLRSATRPLDQQKLVKTTSWHNNSALNCIVGFLSEEFKNKSSEEIGFLYQQTGYREVLREFNRYYRLNLSSGRELQLLMQQYPNPVDQEVIWGPVLRVRLGNLIKKEQQNENSSRHMKNDFLIDVATLLREEENFINPTMIMSNVEFLGKLKFALFNEQDKISEDVGSFVERYKAELLAYWDKTGWRNYAEFIEDLDKSATISEQELCSLAKDLNIRLRIYAANRKEGESCENLVANRSRMLTVFNGGFHWAREIDLKENIAAHNFFYDILQELNENYYQDLEKLIYQLRADEVIYEEYLRRSSTLMNAYLMSALKVISDHTNQTGEKFEFWKVLTPFEVEKSVVQESLQKSFLVVRENQPKPPPAFTSEAFLVAVFQKIEADPTQLATLYHILQSQTVKNLVIGKPISAEAASQFLFSIAALHPSTLEIEQTKRRLIEAERNSPGAMAIQAKTVNDRLQMLYKNHQILFQSLEIAKTSVVNPSRTLGFF